MKPSCTQSILQDITPYLIFFSISHFCYGGPMQSAQESGKSFGKGTGTKSLQQAQKLKTDELMPKDAEIFNSDQAYQNVKSNAHPSTDTLDFLTSSEVKQNERENKNFHQDELFLKQSDLIAAHVNPSLYVQDSEEQVYNLHTCRQTGDPLLLSFERSLNVQVHKEEEVKARVCLGHNKTVFVKKTGDFNHSTSSYRKKFKTDPTIKSYTIQPLQSLREHYMALLNWTHVDNAEGCDKCENQVIKKAEYREVGEEWIVPNQELLALSRSPNSTLIEQTCLDHAPKNINGKQIERQCWKERISFLYRFPETKECNHLKQGLCEQINQVCVQSSEFGCAMWELTFKCMQSIKRQFVHSDPENLFGFNEFHQQETIPPNRSFAEVVTQLAVFDEAKKELLHSNVSDASTLEIFKGQKMTCSKNVVDQLMYDCCFNYSGLSKQIGLSKCSADEISLGERRENGLCHYVGAYEEKVLGLWKSRDEHVFCCFTSKLARVVQEEGRKQLSLDWGKPKEAHCGGFSFDLLSKIDFTQMDLSEIFDQLPSKLPEDFQDKMKSFQNRLTEQIQKEEPEMETKKRGAA